MCVYEKLREKCLYSKFPWSILCPNVRKCGKNLQKGHFSGRERVSSFEAIWYVPADTISGKWATLAYLIEKIQKVSYTHPKTEFFKIFLYFSHEIVISKKFWKFSNSPKTKILAYFIKISKFANFTAAWLVSHATYTNNRAVHVAGRVFWTLKLRTDGCTIFLFCELIIDFLFSR